jgi:Cyclopropane fatty acid synthase and related methyltransferases
MRSLVSVKDELVEMSADEAHRAYIDFIAKSLERFLPATALVELGCGYGSVILDLARRPEFHQMPLFAADFTDSGPRLPR